MVEGFQDRNICVQDAVQTKLEKQNSYSLAWSEDNSSTHLLPWNVLIYVRLLLGAKEKVDKLLVKLLVCVVDTQLLEAVVFKHLEPEDVEHADAALRL